LTDLRKAAAIGDADLVRSVQAGSAEALGTLYERYLPPVWRYVYVCVHADEHAAQDVVSDTFLAAIRGVPKLDPDRGSIYPWLIGLARHKLADHWRRTQRQHGNPHAREAPEAATDQTDPAERLQAAERKDLVASAMTKLADDERLALEWKYVDRLSVADIAARLGRTGKAVEAILYRARNAFRAIYDGPNGSRCPR